jgi:hypothetical protein
MTLNVPVVLRNSRRLQGDILCDASGRLYERVGQYVHPVHHLVAGPHGEVIDLAPPAPRSLPRPAPVIDVEEHAVGHDLDEAPQLAASWREIAAAAAKPRIVRFGEFKNVLAPQLLHPERLRDTHRMSCRVHLYEVMRAQRIETLTADVFDGGGGTLLPLTEMLAVRLELTELVQRRRAAAPANREPGLVFPGERVVRLGVMDDPTAALPTPRQETPRTTEPAATPRPPAPAPAAISPPPTATAAPPPAGRIVKAAVPERFAGPWPFALSRDQAVYDLNVDRARSRWRVRLDRLRGLATSGRELRKWQTLLRGKSLDDQLWAVPPPRGGLGERAVHQWASRTLEAAGYDPGAMLLEWEIFWRRKGL